MQQSRGQPGSRTRRGVAAVRRRWWLPLLAAVVLAAGGYAVWLLVPATYQATAQVAYVRPEPQRGTLGQGATDLAHDLRADAQTVESTSTVARARAGLGLPLSEKDVLKAVSVEANEADGLITIGATSNEPEQAAAVATAVATAYVEVRRVAAREAADRTLALLEDQIKSLTPAESDSELGLALRRRYDELAERAFTLRSDYRLVRKAALPVSQAGPGPVPFVLGGALLGLVSGSVAAVALGRSDRRLRDPAALEAELGLPVLATVPVVGRRWRSRRDEGGRSGEGGGPGAREAGAPGQPGEGTRPEAVPGIGFAGVNAGLRAPFEDLRTALRQQGFGRTLRLLAVTSAVRDEGASSTAINLALSMAFSGERIILVDCDLRRPSIDGYLQAGGGLGPPGGRRRDVPSTTAGAPGPESTATPADDTLARTTSAGATAVPPTTQAAATPPPPTAAIATPGTPEVGAAADSTPAAATSAAPTDTAAPAGGDERPDRRGLVDVLQGEAHWRDLVRPVDLRPFMPEESPLDESTATASGPTPLYCLCAGRLAQERVQLLAGRRMRDLLRELVAVADHVVLDCPPLSSAPDVLSLLDHVDGVLVTSRVGAETLEAARDLREMLDRRVTAVGVVVTGVRPASEGGRRGRGSPPLVEPQGTAPDDGPSSPYTPSDDAGPT